MYATPWHLADGDSSGDLLDYLRLWRFERYYRLSVGQLPRVLSREALDPGTLRFQRWQHAGTGDRSADLAVPPAIGPDRRGAEPGCCTVSRPKRSTCSKTATSATYRSAGQRPRSMRTPWPPSSAPTRDAEHGFLPERHQVVFDEEPAPEDHDDLVQRLIYRTDLPYRKEHSAIRYPGELNRRPGWLAAVGPYVSVICGHPDFIENAIFLSAVQAVGAAAQLRAIRQAAYADVRQFRNLEAEGGTTRDRRRILERIADQLGDLELELSYSVEASADLGLLVPSLRVESFHNALYESMSLAGKAVTAGRMLQRLGSAIRAELTAIESIERRADENRRVRYAVAVGFVSAVAIPASLILAFLGINASQVSTRPVHVQPPVPGHVPDRRRRHRPRRRPFPGAVRAAAPRRPPPPHRDARSRWTLAADDTHIQRAYPIHPFRCAAAPAANLLETSSRFMIAVMCRRTVVMLSPARRAIASSCSPSAISSRTACCAGVSRPAGAGGSFGPSGVARSHSISKYSRSAAMITGARITSAPAVPAGVSGSIAVVWSASFIFIGTRGSSRACSPASAHACDDPPGDRVVHHRGVVDGPAPDPAAVGGQRQLREVVGHRHVGVQVLQRHPVLAGGVRQRCRQLADLRPVGDHADQVLGEPAVHPDPEPGLRVRQAPVPVHEEFLLTGKTVLMARQDALQRQIRRRGPQPRRIGRGVRQDVRHPPVGKRLHQPGAADQLLGLILRAPVLGEQPVIRAR